MSHDPFQVRLVSLRVQQAIMKFRSTSMNTSRALDASRPDLL